MEVHNNINIIDMNINIDINKNVINECEIENINETYKNNYSVQELNVIRDKIEQMTKFNQVEVLRILNKNKNIILNENKYGIHVNLSEVSNSVVEELKNYVNYVMMQEKTLNIDEQQKEMFKIKYFSKDIKDNSSK